MTDIIKVINAAWFYYHLARAADMRSLYLSGVVGTTQILKPDTLESQVYSKYYPLPKLLFQCIAI